MARAIRHGFAAAGLAVLLVAGGLDAQLRPTSWGALKAEDLDAPGLVLDALGDAADFPAGKRPLILEGTYRAGSYRSVLYSWLVTPPALTATDKAIMGPAFEIGIGKWTFAADGPRFFAILDAAAGMVQHFPEAERPPVLAFMLEAVAARYHWEHRTLDRAEVRPRYRLIVDFWRFQRSIRGEN